MLKFAHTESFFSHIITFRDVYLRKNFVAVKKNLASVLSCIDPSAAPSTLIEIGVGYTLTDSIFLKDRFSFSAVHLTDLSNLLNFRTYAIASLLCPQNYLSFVFYKNIHFLLFMLIIGRNALKIYGYTYNVVESKMYRFPPSCAVFSNAVLEHIDCQGISELFKKLKEANVLIFFGIIDTNDHANRDLPLEDQFKNYHGSSNEIQTRGNRIGRLGWDLIFQNGFANYSLNTLVVNHEEVNGVLTYCASDQQVRIEHMRDE